MIVSSATSYAIPSTILLSSACKGLKQLVLTNNSLGDAGVADLSCNLATLPDLVELSVSNNLIGLDGVSTLLRSLLFTNIKVLDLSHNPLDVPAARALSFAMMHNR